jgi:hypothetical protein
VPDGVDLSDPYIVAFVNYVDLRSGFAEQAVVDGGNKANLICCASPRPPR